MERKSPASSSHQIFRSEARFEREDEESDVLFTSACEQFANCREFLNEHVFQGTKSQSGEISFTVASDLLVEFAALGQENSSVKNPSEESQLVFMYQTITYPLFYKNGNFHKNLYVPRYTLVNAYTTPASFSDVPEYIFDAALESINSSEDDEDDSPDEATPEELRELKEAFDDPQTSDLSITQTVRVSYEITPYTGEISYEYCTGYNVYSEDELLTSIEGQSYDSTEELQRTNNVAHGQDYDGYDLELYPDSNNRNYPEREKIDELGVIFEENACSEHFETEYLLLSDTSELGFMAGMRKKQFMNTLVKLAERLPQ